MPSKDQIEARKAMHDLEQDAKHNPPVGGDPVADAQTREDGLDDPKHQAKDRKQDSRWSKLTDGIWSHPDVDQD